MAGGWDAIIAGIIGAGSAYVSSKSAKKENEQRHDDWERRMAYEEEKVARKRNSMGGRMAPYLMEQMLRVYGDQSKGRGGFTLPVDEILQNMQIKDRQNGTYDYNSNGREGGNFSLGNKTAKGSINRDLDSMLTAQLYGSDGKRYLKGQDAEWENPTTAMRQSAMGGASAGSYGSREDTRGMGSTSTQTERGYTTYRVTDKGKGKPGQIDSGNFEGGDETTVTTPNLYGDLATGGEGSFGSRDIPVPPDFVKKLGLNLLKSGASKFIPGVGLFANVAGKIVQKFGKSNGKQSWWETALGIKDKNYGRMFGNNPDPVELAYRPYSDPVTPLG